MQITQLLLIYIMELTCIYIRYNWVIHTILLLDFLVFGLAEPASLSREAWQSIWESSLILLEKLSIPVGKAWLSYWKDSLILSEKLSIPVGETWLSYWKSLPFSTSESAYKHQRDCLTSISMNVSRMSPCWISLKLTREIPHSKLVATSLTSSLKRLRALISAV